MYRDRREYARAYYQINKEKKAAYREAHREEHRAYDKARKEENRERFFLNSYGLSKEQYVELLANGCAICGTLESLCVDHDHACCPGKGSCGKCVRGALCQSHNTALGRFNDNVEHLQNAIDYLTVDKTPTT